MQQGIPPLPPAVLRSNHPEDSNFLQKRRKTQSKHRAKSEIRPLDSENSSKDSIRGRSLALLPQTQCGETRPNSGNLTPLYRFPAALMLRLLCAKRNRVWPQTHTSPCVKLVNIECPEVKCRPKRHRNSSKLSHLGAVSPLGRREAPAPSGGFIWRRLKGLQLRERVQPLRVRAETATGCL